MRIKHSPTITFLLLGLSCASPKDEPTQDLHWEAPTKSDDSDLDADAMNTAVAHGELLAGAGTSCTDQAPPGSNYSCAQQAAWGKCGESWMAGFCNASCNRCGQLGEPRCADVPPAGSAYTCQQQAGWGKCNETWMAGFCNASCNRCGANPNPNAPPPSNPPPPANPPPPSSRPDAGTSARCTDIPPAGNNYTCAQQAGWGKCGESWMVGFCDRSCGRCGGGGNRTDPTAAELGCSLPSDTTARVRFTNLCLASVSLYWVDYNCAERSFGDIGPNEMLNLNSYVGHSFRVRAASSGRYLGDVAQIPTSVNVTICGN